LHLRGITKSDIGTPISIEEFFMVKTYISIAVATALAFSVGGAQAANNTAVINIVQSDAIGTVTTWSENVSGLLVVDANNNFTMATGTPGSFFQNGQFVSSVDPQSHPDYWQWKADTTLANGGYWNWHSAQTVDGTASTPWQSVLNLKNVSGHGDPDLSYAFSASNNTTYTQTYSFSVGEAILPPEGSANVVYADIAGGLNTKDGNVTIAPFGTNTTIQQFRLSSDNGLTFINAGVDVGPSLNATGTTTYGPFAATASGPTGSTWNYMEIVTKFTLTAKDNASLVGFASITPVPEPGSYAMMLSGIALLAGMARRRKI
jgi:hypothetical protein